MTHIAMDDVAGPSAAGPRTPAPTKNKTREEVTWEKDAHSEWRPRLLAILAPPAMSSSERRLAAVDLAHGGRSEM
jgi:hypothetical protein